MAVFSIAVYNAYMARGTDSRLCDQEQPKKLSSTPSDAALTSVRPSVKGEQQGTDLYTSLKANSLRHSSRMPSSSASPMPPYALGSALSFWMWPANARPKADARRLASAHSLQFELQREALGVGGMRGGRWIDAPCSSLNCQGRPSLDICTAALLPLTHHIVLETRSNSFSPPLLMPPWMLPTCSPPPSTTTSPPPPTSAPDPLLNSVSPPPPSELC